ncbi:hypothetical protein ACI3PL_24510, partial [Lacticaseibacillus paracasei]
MKYLSYITLVDKIKLYMSKLNKIIILVAILAIFYGIYILFIEKYFSSNPSNTVGKSIEWGNPDLAKLESDK